MTLTTILCTGGAGYIGAHCAIQLANTGKYRVIIVDNLINASVKAVEAVKKIAGPDKIDFVNVDLVNGFDVLSKLKFDGVIHFAALKAVGESVEKPLEYYDNNINSLLTVLKVMRHVGCKNIVYSSSATVYRPSETPLKEDAPLGACNPYGQSKLIGEHILQDLFVSDNSYRISILRYFNPVGCHESGTIGESPKVPMNILPIIQKVAVGKKSHVDICGNDWDTADGTGVRDYIHVLDIADGHILALDKLLSTTKGNVMVHNLGSGKGYSVLELIAAFEKASGKSIPTKIAPRRPGDLGTVIADTSKTFKELGFLASRSIE